MMNVAPEEVKSVSRTIRQLQETSLQYGLDQTIRSTYQEKVKQIYTQQCQHPEDNQGVEETQKGTASYANGNSSGKI